MSPLIRQGCNPDNHNYNDVRLTPLGYDPDNPHQFDVRRFSSEEVELFNPAAPVNPPNPKSRRRKRARQQQRQSSQQQQQQQQRQSSQKQQQQQQRQSSQSSQLGPISYGAIFSLPGLLLIVTQGAGWIATVLFAAIALIVGAAWAKVCPSQHFLVKNGIMLCGFFTLITAGIGLFILPQYLIVIAMAIAANAIYRATRE